MTDCDTPLPRQSSNWDDYRFVCALADTKSLAGAAEHLGVNHSTVLRRINTIEKMLGLRLFERGRGGYALTAAGEEMVALANRMNEDIASFERRVMGQDVKPSGELRVTTNDSFLTHLMMPIFARFLALFPDIRLDIIVSSTQLNLSRRDADVALRATSSPPDTLVGRRVCKIAWAIYGPKQSRSAQLADLVAQRWIGFSERLASIGPARWLEQTVPADSIAMRINTIPGIAEAIREGSGIGLLPCYIGDTMPLTRHDAVLQDIGGDIWLLTHPDLRQSARVRAFMDYTWEALTKLRPVLEGSG